MKRLSTCFLFGVLLVLSSNVATSQVRTGSFALQFENNGITSVFACWVPEDYDSTKAYPLLYAWHGAGMPATNMASLMVAVIGQDIDAIVVCPDGNNLQTNTQLNALVNTTLGFALNDYNIDPARTIITGFSWGGKIAYQFGMANPNTFTGIIGFSPALGMNDVSQGMWDNVGDIRMATILGDQDFNFTPVDALMKEIGTRGGNILYKVKPGVEHADNTYFNSQEFLDDYRECYNYVVGVTGIQTVPLAGDSDIRVYPSPVRDVVRIEVQDAERSDYDIEFISVVGEVVHVAHGRSAVVNTSDWKSGLYFVRVHGSSGVSYSKFIKVAR